MKAVLYLDEVDREVDEVDPNEEWAALECWREEWAFLIKMSLLGVEVRS